MRRGLLLLALLAGATMLIVRPAGDDRPLAVIGHTGGSTPTSTTAPPPLQAPATTTTAKPAAKVAVANRSSTVVRTDGVTVVNEGSASANTGGNTVIGGPDGASVVNGPVTAVGNSSEVRITPP